MRRMMKKRRRRKLMMVMTQRKVLRAPEMKKVVMTLVAMKKRVMTNSKVLTLSLCVSFSLPLMSAGVLSAEGDEAEDLEDVDDDEDDEDSDTKVEVTWLAKNPWHDPTDTLEEPEDLQVIDRCALSAQVPKRITAHAQLVPSSLLTTIPHSFQGVPTGRHCRTR
jgi:hypothetical protein